MGPGVRYGIDRENYGGKTVALVSVAAAIPALIAFWGTFDIARGVFAVTYFAVILCWYILLRPMLICVNCHYYGKTCLYGLGKVAPLVFRRDIGNDVWGIRLGRFFWPYWYIGVPALGFAFLLVSNFEWRTVVYAGVFGGASVAYFLIDRSFYCGDCLCRLKESRRSYETGR